jgi:tetratricopeptide (TPR) repeat protein
VQDQEPRAYSSEESLEQYERLREMGDCHVALENFEQARMCYRQAAVLAPNRPAPFVGLGAAAMQQGDVAEALDCFRTAVRIDGDCAEAHAGLAMLHQEAGQYAQAFEAYLRCLEIDPDNLMALLGLFQASCQMGTFGKIIHYLELYLKTNGCDVSVQFCLATLYAREDRLIEAKHALLAVLAGEPNKLEAQQLLDDVNRRLASIPTQEVA